MDALLGLIWGACIGAWLVVWHNGKQPPSAGDRFHAEVTTWVSDLRKMNRFAGDCMMGVGVARLSSCGRFKITVEPLGDEEMA